MKLEYIKGNLFNTNDTCIAHCVSSDFKLGAGVAKEVKKRYPKLPLDATLQPLKNGTIGKAYGMMNDNMLIFHLVTKNKYYNKPTYQSLEESLISMKHQLGNINKFSIPKIGCGLDKLEWYRVENIIKTVFEDTNIVITVYEL